MLFLSVLHHVQAGVVGSLGRYDHVGKETGPGAWAGEHELGKCTQFAKLLSETIGMP